MLLLGGDYGRPPGKPDECALDGDNNNNSSEAVIAISGICCSPLLHQTVIIAANVTKDAKGFVRSCL